MSKCILLSLLVIVLGSYAKVQCASSPVTQTAPEPEEYVVYTALLKEMFIDKETGGTDFAGETPAVPVKRLEFILRELSN